jgi:hypothetical protein
MRNYYYCYALNQIIIAHTKQDIRDYLASEHNILLSRKDMVQGIVSIRPNDSYSIDLTK